MNDRFLIAPILATGATGASLSVSWMASAHEFMGVLVTALTLAWWIRLWLKNPNIKPPGNNEDANNRKD